MFQTSAGVPEPGVVAGDQVIGLGPAGFPDLLGVIAGGGPALACVAAWMAEAPLSARFDLASATLLAPLPLPPKIVCVGLNYADHARESGLEMPKVPTIFAKFPNAAIGPGAEVLLPKASAQPDYEAEFAFVVGRGGRYIPADRWREHVFGYTNFNDVAPDFGPGAACLGRHWPERRGAARGCEALRRPRSLRAENCPALTRLAYNGVHVAPAVVTRLPRWLGVVG